MQQLCAIRSVNPAGPGAMGWFQHVVRPLLCPPGKVRAAHKDSAGSHVRLHRKARGRPYQGRCFASAEGIGCELSEEELRISERVGCEPMSWEV
jgi:hypothetical protein